MLISSYLLNYWISKTSENEKFHFKFVELTGKSLATIQPLVGILRCQSYFNVIDFYSTLQISNSIEIQSKDLFDPLIEDHKTDATIDKYVDFLLGILFLTRPNHIESQSNYA